MRKPSIIGEVLGDVDFAKLLSDLDMRVTEQVPVFKRLMGDQGVKWTRGHEPGYAALSAPWYTPDVEFIRWRVAARLGHAFNSCAARLYTGMGSTAPHQDCKILPNLGGDTIAIASFGAERVMRFSDGSEISMPHGSITLLPLEFDREYTHHLPPSPNAGLRLALVYRWNCDA